MKVSVGVFLLLFVNSVVSAQSDTLLTLKNDTIAAKKDSVEFVNTPIRIEIASTEFAGAYDIIKLKDGDSLVVNIITETPTEITFQYPLNYVTNKLLPGKIEEIVYKNGKIKSIQNHKPTAELRAEPDNLWRLVIITQEESEISGLKQIGPITAKAEGRNFKSNLELLEKNAKVNLQRKAVKMNATKILVTNKYVEQAYGEIPSVEYEGIAYGPQ